MPSVAQPSVRGAISRGDSNRLDISDRAAHDWYRFVLSFPPHLVRQYIERFGLDSSACVLDPFCGTGTTIVECKKLGLSSVGIEAHPISHFASATKIDWSPDPDRLEKKDAPVVSTWLGRVLQMAHDLRSLQKLPRIEAAARHADSRMLRSLLKPKSIDAVFTSPPYPNEKDYTRTTRLETVLLGFIRDKHELQKLKRTMVRS